MVSNILVHRDYSSGFPAKIVIQKDEIYTENSNLAHGIGELRLDRFEPFPKNPPISKVFREIGLADELGSGMPNTNKYTKLYSGGTPSFDEGDIFKITIPLKNIATAKVGPDSESVGQGVGQDIAELQELIITLIRENNKVTKQQIAKAASVSEKTVERQMKRMSNIKFVGKGYSGYWEII
jgi:ATP-dependent DNA helicase RecG